jgi:hypothetical protein
LVELAVLEQALIERECDELQRKAGSTVALDNLRHETSRHLSPGQSSDE